MPNQYGGIMSGQITVNIYCDESKDKKDENGNKWDYYGLLIVPAEKERELLKRILNCRCLLRGEWVQEGCQFDCGYHKENNTEISYKDIKRYSEFRIAEKWIDLIFDNNRNNLDMIYFYILGIDKSKINHQFWKHYSDVGSQIYTRFFITGVKGIKFFFNKHKEILINKIIHDSNSLLTGSDKYYYLSLISELSKDTKIRLQNSNNFNIEHVFSDHRKSRKMESHFLQFVDLILGVTVNYIHFTAKNNPKKIALTEKLYPLLCRLIERPKNVNSSYKYYRRQQIQFFPSRRDFYQRIQALDGSISKVPYEDLFYTNRRCLFKEEYLRTKGCIEKSKQPTLDKFY